MSSDIEQELVSNLAVSNHKFMAELYRVLGANDENVFFSPFSIYVALVLAYLGSNGETAEELKKSLFLPEKREHLLEGIRLLLNETTKHPQLNTATEMFLERTYELRNSYKEDAKKFVNSNSQLVNFKTDFERAAELINAWVSSQTKNKINNLIPAGSLDEDTRLVLVNAIHFKDTWLTRFDEAKTYKQNFFISKSSFDEVEMMHETARFGYRAYDSYEVLQLLYANRNFVMMIFLPNEIDGLPALEQKLPELNFAEVKRGLGRPKVRVTLPKFKLENFFDLKGALQKLGMNALFDEEKADLTGIHEPSEDPLYVSKVVHKTFVEVNEEGTEAAAATGVVMTRAKCAPRPEIVHDFTVDHPFIFVILFNDVTLFVGKQLSIPK